MELFLASFLAGMLTVLAPCVVSILPVILSRTTSDTVQPKRRSWVIIGSLLISIFIFSLLLKASTLFIDIPTRYWQVLSGSIILSFGIITLFPSIWEWIAVKLKLQQGAQKGSSLALKKNGVAGDIALGASLGPIFSACSPTYALIVAGILPVSLARGLVYLLAFLAGLGMMLMAISIAGQKLIVKMRWGINPNGWFKRGLAIIFILVGLSILTGYDKKVEAYLVERGVFDWQVSLESKLQ